MCRRIVERAVAAYVGCRDRAVGMIRKVLEAFVLLRAGCFNARSNRRGSLAFRLRRHFVEGYARDVDVKIDAI